MYYISENRRHNYIYNYIYIYIYIYIYYAYDHMIICNTMYVIYMYTDMHALFKLSSYYIMYLCYSEIIITKLDIS